MQQAPLAVALALSAALFRLALGINVAGAQVATPVGRVVALLQGLKTKLAQDFKAEEDLYETYECWAKTIIDTKTASNAAAQSRKDSLEQYIQDIESGKFEFTTERVDLEKQVAGLNQDLQIAGDLRTKENEDFEAAKEEMAQAIAALRQAIGVLEGAAPSSLLAHRSIVSVMTARQSMEEALRLSRSTLAANDLRLMERMAAGEVPTWDWKKLNRKATYKMKYNSQTGRIVKTLKALEDTFVENLAEATSKEASAKSSYDSLKASKDGMLDKAGQALVDLVAEHGARELTKSEAQAEVDALGTQITADTQFISETRTAASTKANEWAERTRLRNMELAAIAEAIEVLHNDEARDQLKVAYKSKGYLFFQASQRVSAVGKPVRSEIAQKLQKLASTSRDHRLSTLAMAVSATSGTRSIAAVIQAIDNLLTSLRAEETSDLTRKEQCESQRQEKTRLAKTQSVAIDDLSDEIDRAQAKVEEIEAQIKEQDAIVLEQNETLVMLDRQRIDENTRYVQDKADDQQAVELIDQAIAVMTKLQQDMMAGLAVGSRVSRHSAPDAGSAAAQPVVAGLVDVHSHDQQHAPAAAVAAKAAHRPTTATPKRGSALILGRSSTSQKQPFDVQAGEAPLPPPATWAEPTYKGASGEQKGIQAILTLLKEDMEADIVAADGAEGDAVTAYEKQKGDTEVAMQAAQDAITGYETEKATEDQTVVTKGVDRGAKKGELDGTMAEIKAAEPGCDFFLVNYGVRRTSRQIEIDGLEKAKDFLQGANFA